MITYTSLPMNLKTIIVTLFFLTMIAGICTSLIVGKRQGRVKRILLPVCTAVVAAMLLLYGLRHPRRAGPGAHPGRLPVV